MRRILSRHKSQHASILLSSRILSEMRPTLPRRQAAQLLKTKRSSPTIPSPRNGQCSWMALYGLLDAHMCAASPKSVPISHGDVSRYTFLCRSLQDSRSNSNSQTLLSSTQRMNANLWISFQTSHTDPQRVGNIRKGPTLPVKQTGVTEESSWSRKVLCTCFVVFSNTCLDPMFGRTRNDALCRAMEIPE